jgi:hypothetical protein
VVRRNVTDALIVVYRHLVQLLRPVTRQHAIEDSAGAERDVNVLFLRPQQMPEGITISSCYVRLSPDAAARRYLRETLDDILSQ